MTVMGITDAISTVAGSVNISCCRQVIRVTATLRVVGAVIEATYKQVFWIMHCMSSWMAPAGGTPATVMVGPARAFLTLLSSAQWHILLNVFQHGHESWWARCASQFRM